MNAADRPLVRLTDAGRDFDVSRPWLNRVLEGAPRQLLRAVDGVSFDVAKGETLALVGESGCGKSTVARLIVGLYPLTRGRVEFDGADLAAPGTDTPAFRRRMQMIFQDPYASLNPRWRVRDIVAEPIRVLGLAADRDAERAGVAELLRQVGLAPEDGEKFPHEFSGGQRQRISIARALSGNPEFLVCDEPTSALDVSVQAQILNLMTDLQERLGLTYLFISHNLGVVRYMSQRIGVMYLGHIVEQGATADVFLRPQHPYTRVLLSALPSLDPDVPSRRQILAGDPPTPINPPPGCPFAPRCPEAQPICTREKPSLMQRGTDPTHLCACHFPMANHQ